MDRNGTSISEMENENLEILRTRADAVRSAMATAENVLAFTGSSPEMKASARARIMPISSCSQDAQQRTKTTSTS